MKSITSPLKKIAALAIVFGSIGACIDTASHRVDLYFQKCDSQGVNCTYTPSAAYPGTVELDFNGFVTASTAESGFIQKQGFTLNLSEAYSAEITLIPAMLNCEFQGGGSTINGNAAGNISLYIECWDQ